MTRTAMLVSAWVFLAAGLADVTTWAAPAAAEGRFRVCVLTDLGGDPDDEQSLMRFLVLANMYDVEGIVLSPFKSSRRPDCTPYHARDHVNYVLDRYAKAVERLNRHAAFAGQHSYPPAERLREVTRLGLYGFKFHDEEKATMERFIGPFGDHEQTDDRLMRGMTPGSKLIVEILAKPDPRPVYFSIWGGAATLQQAICEIRNNWGPWEFSAAQRKVMLDKVRVYSIDGQDFSDPHFFQVEPQRSRFYYIDCDSFWGMHQQGDRGTLTKSWIDEHIKGHGSLGKVGPAITDPDITKHPIYPYVKPPRSDAKYAMKEGDTPGFLGLVSNGLSFPGDPRAQDWGGQYEPAGGELWDDLDGIQDRPQAVRGMDAIAKWRPHFNADFQARMDWMSQDDVAKANHHPIAAIDGQTHRDNAPVRIDLRRFGDGMVRLSAAASSDPDGDTLSYHWQRDGYVDTYEGAVAISDPDDETTRITFEGQPGKVVHIVLTVADDGTPHLRSYRRVIITLPEN